MIGMMVCSSSKRFGRESSMGCIRRLTEFAENIRKFLPNTIQAMGPDSRLLIEEFVLPDTGADLKTTHLDIMMMVYHSGMERTLTQWERLLDSCGVRIAKVWSRPDTDSSVLECRLKG